MLRTAYGKDMACPLSVLIAARFKRTLKICLLILAGLQLQSFKSGESQVVSLSFKEAPLSKVFAEIRKQTGYSFAYFETDLAKAKPVNIHISNIHLQDALNTLFRDQPLTYTIIEKVVVVKQKNSEKKISENLNLQQAYVPIDLRGRVLNEREDPVAGVTVQVKGSKTGTSTDGDGEFELKNVAANATLVLTAVNIEPIETPVMGQRNLDLRVKGRSGKLDEVQVIAYGRSSQRFNTGNVTTIKAEDIEKQPVSNPLFALQGRVPGLLITQNTGMANGAFTVRIQGQNSILNGNNPLIVVDGIPFSYELPSGSGRVFGPLNPVGDGASNGNNPIGFINPADIESIDVLKDADATAIYGSRAANGAILITTKRGKSGKTKISVGLQQGWSRVGHKLNLMNTQQYLDMRYEAIKNDGLTIGTTASYDDLRLWDTTRYTDWQHELIGGTASYTNANVSVSGGTSTAKYLIGGTYNRTTTVFPGDFANKSGTIHFNISTASSDQKFKLSLTGSYTVNENGVPGADLTSNALNLVPIAPAIYNPDGTLNWAPNAAGNSTWNNPLANTAFRKYDHEAKLLTSSAQVSYTLLQGLALKTNLGYNHTQVNSFLAVPIESARPERRNNTTRASNFSNANASTWLIEPQITFNKSIKKMGIEVLGGATIQKNTGANTYIYASGFPSDLLIRNITSSTFSSLDYRLYVYRYNALFSRINLNWDKKYLLNITGRRDGSSRFGENNIFNNFWSFGAGWIFSEESIIKDVIPILSFGKIRASYGITGSDGIPDYSFLNTYVASTAGIPYQGIAALKSSGINNPYVQWEETRKLQTGLDLGFFQDRLLMNFTFSRNRSSNQLIYYILPSTTGVESVFQNSPATIQNINWEFSLSTNPIKRKNISWTSSFNLTITRNKVIAFPNIENTSYANGTSGIIIGQPIGANYYYHYLGMDPATGNYTYSDENGNPFLTPNRDILEGKTLLSLQPRYYGGWINSVTYKGFSLDFIFQFIRQPNFFLEGVTGSYTPGQFSLGEGNQPVSVLANRWQKPGDKASITRFRTAATSDRIRSSDAAYTFDASFIRLKNVSLSWQFPTNWLKTAHLQNGTLYFRGQNLATITHYAGLDPETGNSTLPPLQTWSIGFNLVF